MRGQRRGQHIRAREGSARSSTGPREGSIGSSTGPREGATGAGTGVLRGQHGQVRAATGERGAVAWCMKLNEKLSSQFLGLICDESLTCQDLKSNP
jgi:hypothetical protein